MAEQDDVTAFASSLAADIRDKALGDAVGAEFRENAFVEIVADHLAEIGMLDNPEVCYYEGRVGNGIVRLNGYAVSDDGERLDLLVAIFGDTDAARTVAGEELARVAGQAARALTAAKRNVHEQMERASDAFAMMQRISEVLGADADQVRVFVITDGVSAARGIKPATVGGIDVRFEVYDIRRLARTMGNGQNGEVIDIRLTDLGLEPIPCIAMPSGGEDYEAYLAIIPGDTLYRMYEEFGPRLLEYNVRAFLQASGKVNRGIRDTLRDEPQHFMAYNNGISVTVDEVETERINGSGLVITRLKGLQIVNGGQTTASIHRGRRRDRLDLSAVHVPAKITRLPVERIDDMVPKISRYANTQNVIQEADFSSNEPFHVVLERLSKALWAPSGRTRWFYERARGQYQTAMNLEGATPARLRDFKERTPPSQRFTKTDLAKYLNSWNRLPHLVSGGAQKNFVAFMRGLRQSRGTTWEPDEAFYRDLVAKAILFGAATRIVRQEKFPAYRANIVCYLVAYLSHRCGGQLESEEIWRQQGISAPLEQMLRDWAHPIADCIQESADGRNVTEWSKKEACWNSVKLLDLEIADVRPVELAVAGEGADSGPVLDPDAQSAASECMKLTGEQWFALQTWGRRTGELTEWQAGIAHTLSSYAAAGWQRTPSVKQARQAMRILEVARHAGWNDAGKAAASVASGKVA
ncbi:MAG: AIPR family protein [Burkholderiales bacterium]